MRTWLGRHRRVGAPPLVLLLLALAGCGGSQGDPHAHASAPLDAGHCNDLPLVHGDPGLVVGTHWSSDRHAWGDAVTMYACADPGLHGTVRVSASDARIRVSPPEASLDGSGVYPFRVTPSRGASGGVEVWFEGSGGTLDVPLHGPRVDRDADGWHFTARTN